MHGASERTIASLFTARRKRRRKDSAHVGDANRTPRIANPGHCPPLILRRDGTVESIASTGPVIGMLSEARWSSTTTRLERGDTLVLYSDGLVEAHSANGEEFGVGSLQKSLKPRPGATAASLAAGILEAVQRHTNGARQDDLTLVIVRR